VDGKEEQVLGHTLFGRWYWSKLQMVLR
jgi:hypothetical protein